MIKRILTLAIVVTLGLATSVSIGASSAEAQSPCAARSPFISVDTLIRETGFGLYDYGEFYTVDDYLSESDVYDYDTLAIQARQSAASWSPRAPQASQFLLDLADYFELAAQGTCAQPAAYPEIENAPPAPGTYLDLSGLDLTAAVETMDSDDDATAGATQAASVPAPVAAGGGTSSVLAYTGAETAVLGFLGTGLIGFGALSLAMRRCAR